MIYETARLQRQLFPIPRTVQISCVDKALLGPPVAWVNRFFFLTFLLPRVLLVELVRLKVHHIASKLTGAWEAEDLQAAMLGSSIFI